MSRTATTLDEDYQNIVDRARKHITVNKESRRLILAMDKNRIKNLNTNNRREVKRLVQLGVINLSMDNKIYLSYLGKTIAKIIKNL